jgi:hypothetical protein
VKQKITYQYKGNEDGSKYALANKTSLSAKLLPYAKVPPVAQNNKYQVSIQ